MKPKGQEFLLHFLKRSPCLICGPTVKPANSTGSVFNGPTHNTINPCTVQVLYIKPLPEKKLEVPKDSIYKCLQSIKRMTIKTWWDLEILLLNMAVLEKLVL